MRPWPGPITVTGAEAARDEIDWVIRFITAVRTVRAEMNVPPSVKAPVLLRDAAPVTHRRAQAWLDAATRLARISVIEAAPAQTAPGSAQLGPGRGDAGDPAGRPDRSRRRTGAIDPRGGPVRAKTTPR